MKSRNSTNVLLPCPFCGSTPKWGISREGEKIIRCENDDCFGPHTTATDEDAIAQWNKRAPSPDFAQAREMADSAFEEYRREKFSAYGNYPIDAYTYFCAGYAAAIRALQPPKGE